jgi:hypothetical protein
MWGAPGGHRRRSGRSVNLFLPELLSHRIRVGQTPEFLYWPLVKSQVTSKLVLCRILRSRVARIACSPPVTRPSAPFPEPTWVRRKSASAAWRRTSLYAVAHPQANLGSPALYVKRDSWLGWRQHTFAERIETGTAIHGALDQLEPVDLAFNLAPVAGVSAPRSTTASPPAPRSTGRPAATARPITGVADRRPSDPIAD